MSAPASPRTATADRSDVLERGVSYRSTETPIRSGVVDDAWTVRGHGFVRLTPNVEVPGTDAPFAPFRTGRPSGERGTGEVIRAARADRRAPGRLVRHLIGVGLPGTLLSVHHCIVDDGEDPSTFGRLQIAGESIAVLIGTGGASDVARG